jgi:hypothetical protein
MGSSELADTSAGKVRCGKGDQVVTQFDFKMFNLELRSSKASSVSGIRFQISFEAFPAPISISPFTLILTSCIFQSTLASHSSTKSR